MGWRAFAIAMYRAAWSSGYSTWVQNPSAVDGNGMPVAAYATDSDLDPPVMWFAMNRVVNRRVCVY